MLANVDNSLPERLPQQQGVLFFLFFFLVQTVTLSYCLLRLKAKQ